MRLHDIPLDLPTTHEPLHIDHYIMHINLQRVLQVRHDLHIVLQRHHALVLPAAHQLLQVPIQVQQPPRRVLEARRVVRDAAQAAVDVALPGLARLVAGEDGACEGLLVAGGAGELFEGGQQDGLVGLVGCG